VARNIDVGDVISKVFATYTAHAGVLLPVAALLFLIEAAFRVLGLESAGLALLAAVISIVLSTLYTGMVVELVNDVRDGRLDQSVGGLFNSVTPVLLPLIAVSILAAIGLAIGFVLLIIPGLFLLTFWSVVAPVTVLERPGVFAAFSRSWELVKGNGWQVFGVIVLFILIFIAIGIVLGIIGAILGDAGEVVLGYVGSVITAPLVALAASVLYFDLKDVREGVPGPGPEVPGSTAPPPSPPPPPPSSPSPPPPSPPPAGAA
jgi:hypothetical protein